MSLEKGDWTEQGVFYKEGMEMLSLAIGEFDLEFHYYLLNTLT